MIVCKACYSPVRPGRRGEYFHVVDRYKGLETQAREVTEIDEQQTEVARAGFGKLVLTPEEYMEVAFEGV